MPKTGDTLSLDYLASPTPARTLEAAPLLTSEQPQPQQTPPPPNALASSESPDNMDVFDSLETQKGLDASMHAPEAMIVPPLYAT